MGTEVGRIAALYRYPVKSMRGEALETAALGWDGLDGDRRFALRRLDARSDFPWLSASRLPELVCFTPERHDPNPRDSPTHVRTPEGERMPLFSRELAAEIERRAGSPVEMMEMKHGVFDEASVSVIATETIAEICRLAGHDSDVRRFRPNILVRATNPAPFEEDRWVGGVLTFGDANDAPAVTITQRDVRCAMVNLDPDGGLRDPALMKTVVRVHDNTAGVYATVARTGRLAVGQAVVLHPLPL